MSKHWKNSSKKQNLGVKINKKEISSLPSKLPFSV